MSLSTIKKEQIIKAFGKNAEDTGSAQVQIALLTERILEVTEHLKKNKHDFSSKRGLLKMVADRRGFLKYLEATEPEAYRSVTQRLGLK